MKLADRPRRARRATPALCLGPLLAGLLLAPASGCGGEVRRIGDAFCHGVIDGARCDDGDACTLDDRCGQGLCVGRAVPDGTVCDDDDACTVDDECRAGVCGGLDLCQEPDATAPSDGDAGGQGCGQLAAGSACDDGDPCTADDACANGRCQGTPADCSASDGVCAVGVCDPDTGACVAQDRSDGAACSDGDPCTVGESCVSGACGGAIFAPDGSPCDDGDADTAGDRCASGLCAGTVRACDDGCCDAGDGEACDDGDACTSDDACERGRCVGAEVALDCTSLDTACLVGACDPLSGLCERVALPSGGPCDDGDLCTLDDACQDGRCRGTARDCGDLDGPCVVGICEAATGACAIVARADGMPCNDGDPCTGHDDCTGAVCGGEVDLCGACAGKQPGAPCDDGDACSAAPGACVQVAGGLRCEVQLTACSDPGAICAVDACDAASGGCALVALHDTAACDDGDPCTVGDRCAGGACDGTPRELCEDEAPDYCETAAANNAIGDAIPLALRGADVTILGALDHGADTDWYAFDARAGQLIDLTTRAHCGSSVRTALTLVRPSGDVTVSSGAATPWASVTSARAPTDGTYHVAVSAIGGADAATYFLDVGVRDAPPCGQDADCGCEQLMCAVGGAAAGTCVPALPIAQEPDDGAADATVLPLDSPFLGRIVSPSDQDWFRLSLSGGTAVTVTTAPSCDEGGDAGGTIDTALRLYAPDGVTELAFAGDDGAGAASARLTDFGVPADGDYLLRVAGQAGAIGPYVVTASVSGCGPAEPCQCADQICDDSESVGRCVPRLTAPEPADPSAAPVALLLSQRLHVAIDAPYDQDAFSLTLGEGSYDILTTSFCGASLDTRLTVWDDGATDGPVVVAEDDDGGAERFAAVTGLTVATARTLRIVVSARGAAVGDYIITVRAAAEAP